MNVTYLKDRSFRKLRDRTTEQLLGYDLGAALVKELESELPKLLPELSRADIERIEESF